MKIAIAGHPETTLIPHFGHAELFTIFDVSEAQPRLLETRWNRPHCGDSGGDRPQLEHTVALLADCTAVLAGKIGPCARDALIEHEIIPMEHAGLSLDEAQGLLPKLKIRLRAYAQRNQAAPQSEAEG
ncbi:MAG: dinitrogenase iron-molybdenum cofactor biosynthesis protein [Chloroflexales bacterium]|nr:dinitrogenase iron-molybdenum cofactor biosynthesis protein [Chloroflexales bacterium]